MTCTLIGVHCEQVDKHSTGGAGVISLVRDNQLHHLHHDAFWRWARDGQLRATDLLLDANGEWHPATAYPELASLVVVPEQPKSDVIGTIAKVALVAVGGFALYKIGQAVFDEDFGGRAYPAWFRREKIASHVKAHGTFCFDCRRHVREDELTVDHIVAWAKGGLTSRQNAAVICGSCNSSKGAKVGLFDHLRGRSA